MEIRGMRAVAMVPERQGHLVVVVMEAMEAAEVTQAVAVLVEVEAATAEEVEAEVSSIIH